jgi:hypothetical protein
MLIVGGGRAACGVYQDASCLTPVYYGRYLGFDKAPHLWGGFAEMEYFRPRQAARQPAWQLGLHRRYQDAGPPPGSVSIPRLPDALPIFRAGISDFAAREMRCLKATVVPRPDIVE